MKTNILPASDPTYTLVAGKLLEGMKIDQKKISRLLSWWLLWLLGEFALAERTMGGKDTEKDRAQVVLTGQNGLNLLGAGLLVLPQTLISLEED